MSEKWQQRWLLAIVAVALAVYASSLFAELTFDDGHTIVWHPGVQDAFSFSKIFLRDFWGNEFTAPTAVGTWRPLVTLTFWIDRHLARGAPWPFHATNLLLFAALLVMLDRFLRRWAEGTLSPTARLLTVGAFALMTIHADVVPSATGRAELLAMLLSIVALHLAVHPQPKTRHFVLMGVALLGAMASKESALPMAVLLPIFTHRRTPRVKKDVLVVAAVSLSVLAAMIAFRASRLPFHKTGLEMQYDNVLMLRPAPQRLFGAMQVLSTYLEHSATALDLCPDYSYAAVVPTDPIRATLGVVLAISAMALLGVLLRRGARSADALLAFGATYVVASSVIVPASAMLADRLFFFPSLWVLVLLAYGGDAIARARPNLRSFVVGAAIVAIVGQGLLTALAARIWHDDRTLTSYAVQACPNVIRLRLLRAQVQYNNGAPDEAAWSTLVASALLTQFPTPIPLEAFPPEWEELPLDKRLELFVQRLGGVGPALQRILVLAHNALRSQNQPMADQILAGWFQGAAP